MQQIYSRPKNKTKKTSHKKKRIVKKNLIQVAGDGEIFSCRMRGQLRLKETDTTDMMLSNLSKDLGRFLSILFTKCPHHK